MLTATLMFSQEQTIEIWSLDGDGDGDNGQPHKLWMAIPRKRAKTWTSDLFWSDLSFRCVDEA
jgi:hypothetical protein